MSFMGFGRKRDTGENQATPTDTESYPDDNYYGPWDSSEIGTSVLESEEPLHGDFKRMSFTSCEFDIPVEYCSRVELDTPDGAPADSVWFFTDDDTGKALSLRVLASPKTGDYWADELVNGVISELKEDTGEATADVKIETQRGEYGDEVLVTVDGISRQRIVGVTGRDGFAWTVVATLVGDELTDSDIFTIHDVLGSMIVYRPENTVMTPGTPMEFQVLVPE